MNPEDDPFFSRFFERVGADAARSFTDAQLDAIKRAFGARGFASHGLDLRFSVPLLFTRLYFVLLIGRERRHAPRLKRAMIGIGQTTLAVFLIIAALVGVTLAVYPIKTAAGIDLIENGGLHEWVIDPLLAQIKRLFG